MSDAEIERLGSELVAACDREAAARERAAAMERRAEAAWAALREQVVDQHLRTEAAASHIKDLRRLLNDAQSERSEQQDRAKQAEARARHAEARLAAVIALCERTYAAAVGYRDLVIDASEVRAAATGTDPEAKSI